MANLMLVSLSGSEQGKTYIFDKEAVLIGTDKACDLRIAEGENGRTQNGIIAEILRKPYGFQLSHLDNEQCAISINNNPIAKMPKGATIELQDGDLLGFRQNAKEARFSLHVIEDKSIRPE